MGGDSSPTLRKPALVTGHNLVFRDATVDDAEFILGLRTDAQKSKYLSHTPPDLAKQVAWLERYAQDDGQVYFIIENRDRRRVGTIRLYDQRGTSFCWGSWIKADDAPPGFGIESASMIYHYALRLGFRGAHFDVRKGNTSVWTFHERFGAVRVGESDLDYFYEIDRAKILEALERYRRYLPNGIEVQF